MKIDNGYRRVLPGETICAGDEVWADRSVARGQWEPTSDAGRKLGTCDLAYRRRDVPPGEGYRLLAVGEDIKEGDEYRSKCCPQDDWTPTGDAGAKVRTTTTVDRRRKVQVDPGAGYRLLNRGETIEDGDEFFTPRNGWVRWVACVGDPLLGNDPATRRKLTVEKHYRLLRVGETIVGSDEFYLNTTGKWESASDYGILVVNAWHAPVRREMELAYVGGPA